MGIDADRIEIEQRPEGALLSTKVVPGASRTGVAGLWGKSLKVTVTAPAESGRANAAVVDLLAEILEVERSGVVILSGRTRPLKRVLVAGLTARQIRERLAGYE